MSTNLIKDLWTTEVGSSMWNMFQPGKSDHDYCTIRQFTTKLLLSGYKNPGTWPSQIKNNELNGVTIDQNYLEIEHLVGQLLKGNINALWYVMSPIVIKDHPYLHELRKIIIDNPSKLPYHSIRGMAISQQRDEIKRPVLAKGKGYRTAIRTLLFGQYLLKDWEFNFNVKELYDIENVTTEEVNYHIERLERTYINSELPTEIDDYPFRHFLYKVRCNELLDIV